jgi:hypothetical protein
MHGNAKSGIISGNARCHRVQNILYVRLVQYMSKCISNFTSSFHVSEERLLILRRALENECLWEQKDDGYIWTWDR